MNSFTVQDGHFAGQPSPSMGGLYNRPRPRQFPQRRAFTLFEMFAVLAVVALLMSVLVPTASTARSHEAGPPDAAQILAIHEAWLLYADGNDGIFPTPGLINRQPVMGENIPGVGAEDQLQNRTAYIHSALIMLGYYAPEICVGTTEPSELVVVKDDYDYSIYDPLNDVYWDTSFQVELNTGSNLSYASMPVAGARKVEHWRANDDDKWVIVGNRGVRDGQTGSAHYDNSITLKIHGSKKSWEGFECFNDHHIERLKTFVPQGLEYVDAVGQQQPDNIFRNDNFGAPSTAQVNGNDCWLAVTRRLLGTSNSATAVQNTWD